MRTGQSSRRRRSQNNSPSRQREFQASGREGRQTLEREIEGIARTGQRVQVLELSHASAHFGRDYLRLLLYRP